jgi:plasmid stabilization system protein ParE
VTLPVRITPEAELHVRDIHAWWRTNRLSAPDLFLNELATAGELLAEAPQLGRPYAALRSRACAWMAARGAAGRRESGCGQPRGAGTSGVWTHTMAEDNPSFGPDSLDPMMTRYTPVR